jgi:MSHA biogenesis protein MshK
LILFACAGLTLGAALAQPLRDPTRPPSAGSEPAHAAAAEPRRLQSVLISPYRSVAVIDGRPVSLGERVGGARLIAISPAEVTLEQGASRQVLKLLPAGVDKRPVKP